MTLQVIYNFMKELYLHDMSIHTKLHQNRSRNECARMIFCKNVVFYDLG